MFHVDFADDVALPELETISSEASSLTLVAGGMCVCDVGE